MLKLVNTLIANTKGEGEKSAEDFWVKSERLFYTALIGCIWYEAPAEEMNFTTLLEMINASEAREDDPDFQSPVDLMFERLEQKTRTTSPSGSTKVFAVGRIYALSDFLIMILSWLVKQSLRAFFVSGGTAMRNEKSPHCTSALSRDDELQGESNPYPTKNRC